jgi:hypothetical protein
MVTAGAMCMGTLARLLMTMGYRMQALGMWVGSGICADSVAITLM